MTTMELIEKLCNADGISGREEKVREELISYLGDCCEYRTDARGNLICHKQGKKPGNKKVMLTARMDEAGFMITGIREDGLLSFANVGDLDNRAVLGKAVRIDGKTIGVIGTKPIHLQTKEEQDKPVSFDQLYIDIGASSKPSAESAVSLGAQVTFVGEGVAAFGNGYLTGKAMETRSVCAMLAEMLKEEWDYDIDVVFNASSQAMTSAAANAAFALKPDIALILGAAPADDGRGGNRTCCLGKGAAISLHDQMTYYDADLYNLCAAAAKEEKILLQQPERSTVKNESRSVQLSCAGVRVLSVSVPCRYPNTVSAMICQQDLTETKHLLRAFLKKVQG